MELNGVWRAAHADDDLRRDAIGLDADDSAWAEIGVPGHWRRHPEFATSEGRCSTAAVMSRPGRRRAGAAG